MFAGTPTLPFTRDEHMARQAKLRATLAERGFDAILVFAQESHFWLTGYDTGGFVFFQCAVITADDAPITLLTRRPDLFQARQTSTIEDIRLWWDAEDADPAGALREILREKGLAGKRIAVEMNTHGLTGWNLYRVQTAMAGFCTLEFDQHLIRLLRLVKSPAEIEVMRRAGKLLDKSLDAVIAAARPGVMDSALTATYLSVVLGGGGDMPPNAPLFNSGARALYGRGVSQPRALDPIDQIIVEYPVAIRRYNVKTEWLILLGQCTDTQRRMFDTVRSTLDRMTEISRPGTTLGEIFDAHAHGLDSAGYAAARFGATGYSVGLTYAPTSMDTPPMIYAGNPTVCRPGMVLFFHVMLGDMETGYAAGVGHTLLITEGAPEILTGLPDDLTVIK
ncbi:Xaa-Pro peptidase family protein [Acidisphaera sp. L21]|uniref:M24 family metallopeptidase n=1 Tax=Acidisphaera sp. L21 TaxID=1641851 RepID=UPI00131C2A3F|nr:Xaa-Pro peptidase family protein [Acidisphaera sp. L21]